MTEAECDAVERILSREPKDSVISMYNLRRKVECAPADALEVKKGAIKAYLFTKCLPRVLANLVDDEDDE